MSGNLQDQVDRTVIAVLKRCPNAKHDILVTEALKSRLSGDNDEQAFNKTVTVAMATAPYGLFTPREYQTLACAAHGLSARETGKVLHVTTETVKQRRKAVMRKLQAKNMVQAVHIANERKML